MTKKLNELFDEVRARQLQEEFQIGQAAQALQSLKKATQEFQEFLDGPFTQAFKAIHADPRNIPEGVDKLVAVLDARREKLERVVDDVKEYLWDVDTNLNPESPSKDKHHQDRVERPWSRWEHKPKS